MHALAPPFRRASIAQRTPLLPPAPSTRTTAPGRTRPRGLRRGTRHVERREGHALRKILRQLRARPARKEYRLAIHVELSARASTARTRSTRSGVSDKDTNEATRSPTWGDPSPEGGATWRTRPTSIPPEPVTGLCCLPRAATVRRTMWATPSSGPSAACSICTKLAASMFNVRSPSSVSPAKRRPKVVVELERRLRQAPSGSTTSVRAVDVAARFHRPEAGASERGAADSAWRPAARRRPQRLTWLVRLARLRWTRAPSP